MTKELVNIMDLLQFQHFHFVRPEWFIFIAAFIVVIRYVVNKDSYSNRWKAVMSEEMLEAITVQGNINKLISPNNLSIVLIVVSGIILAGPTWKQQPSPFTEDNSALIIALDLSETMEQGDVQPSRLMRAKQKINELLEVRGDTNTALIAFAGSSHIVMPITSDKEMIRHFLDTLEPKMMPKSGKSPERVLPLAKKLLDSTNVPGTLLVVGDGVNNQSITAFSTFFAEQNHQLIYWAVGKTTEELSGDAGSNIITLKLENIESLVSESSGRVVKMADTASDIDRVNQYIENNLVIVDDAARPWHESTYPLIVLLALVYLFWFRKGWTISW